MHGPAQRQGGLADIESSGKNSFTNSLPPQGSWTYAMPPGCHHCRQRAEIGVQIGSITACSCAEPHPETPPPCFTHGGWHYGAFPHPPVFRQFWEFIGIFHRPVYSYPVARVRRLCTLCSTRRCNEVRMKKDQETQLKRYRHVFGPPLVLPFSLTG